MSMCIPTNVSQPGAFVHRRLVAKKKIEVGSLAWRWRYARELAGLTMNALDEKIGFSKTGGFSSRIESGEKEDPKLRYVEAAADVLGCEPAWLAWGRGDAPAVTSMESARRRRDTAQIAAEDEPKPATKVGRRSSAR